MIFIQNKNKQTQNNSWIGFGDLMTGMMLVFIILSLAFISISKQKIDEAIEDKKKIEKLIKNANEIQKKVEEKRKNIIIILANKLAMNNIKVDYNVEKGTVTIAQDILFLQKKSDLNLEGKSFIELFAVTLDKNIFNNDEYRNTIKYIHIEGYASKEGTDNHNFALSFHRAKNVWNFMTDSNIVFKSTMQHKLNIVSRGEIEANQNFVDESDRKVIFRFEFYDEYSKLFDGLSE